MKSCKDKINAILTLVDKSERNIIRIQNVSNAFVYPVLNQWRYATRHMANILALDENDRDKDVEIQKTLTSLKMAYCDSCEILLLIYLRQAVLFFERYRCVKGCDSRFFSDYVETYISGRKFLEHKRWGEPTEVALLMQNMEKTIESLQQCYARAMEKKPFFEDELKRYCRQRRAFLFSIIVSIVVVLLIICITILEGQ